MNSSNESKSSQTLNIERDAYGITQEGDVFQSFGEADFNKVSLEDLESQTKELPAIQSVLLNKLKENRMLVLGGELGGINKNELILQLAYLLASDSQTNSILVKTWIRKTTKQIVDLEGSLRKTQTSTIFLLNDIEPQNITSTSLQVIYNTAEKLNHWVLATTNRSFSSWHLGNSAKAFFKTDIELSLKEIYGEKYLVEKLVIDLEKYKSEKKYNLKEEAEKHFKEKDESLESVAKKLERFQSITRFVKLFDYEVQKLIKDEKEVQEEHASKENKKTETDTKYVPTLIDIYSLIDKAKEDDREFIRYLFYEKLKPKEQLLALGLSFFNGLFEDQLFAALEQVVQEAWQKRDPSLTALDYEDLVELKGNYFELFNDSGLKVEYSKFKYVKTEAYPMDIRSLKVLSLENRLLLFKVTWESHRRQIINALDILAKIVKESVIEENHFLPGKWELYGDLERRQKLHKVISDTFSSIGQVSISALNAVQDPLLQLARNKNQGVREVAARAIASWYNEKHTFEENKKLLRTLQFLYSFSLQVENNLTENLWKRKWSDIEEQLKGHRDYYIDSKYEDIKPHDCMGVTVALILGDTIFGYYREETLDRNLYDWLKELSQSRLRLVHFYFGYHTLYWTTPYYLNDVKKMLKELVRDHKYPLYETLDKKIDSYAISSLASTYVCPKVSLSSAVARSLAHAYSKRSENHENVKEILNYWYNDAMKGLEDIKAPEYNRKSKGFFSFIGDCFSGSFKQKRRETVNENDSLIRTVVLTYALIQYDENHPISLKEVFSRLAIIIKAYQNSSEVYKSVIFTTFVLTHQYLNEIEEFLSGLVPSFDRAEQESLTSELVNIHFEEIIRLKTDNRNSLTIVESVMNKWARLNNTSAQKIAIQTLVSLEKIPKEQIEKYAKQSN